MEFNVLEDKKTRLVFELKGEDHTLCNALREELYNDSDVDVAAYSIRHPLVSEPKFILETSKKSPRDALKAAVKRLQAKNKDLTKQFKKVLK